MFFNQMVKKVNKKSFKNQENAIEKTLENKT